MKRTGVIELVCKPRAGRRRADVPGLCAKVRRVVYAVLGGVGYVRMCRGGGVVFNLLINSYSVSINIILCLKHIKTKVVVKESSQFFSITIRKGNDVCQVS